MYYKAPKHHLFDPYCTQIIKKNFNNNLWRNNCFEVYMQSCARVPKDRAGGPLWKTISTLSISVCLGTSLHILTSSVALFTRVLSAALVDDQQSQHDLRKARYNSHEDQFRIFLGNLLLITCFAVVRVISPRRELDPRRR